MIADRRGALLRLLAAATAVTAGGCGMFGTYTYRYRLTVEVDTPQGLQTGSSVWETSATEGSGIPNSALRYLARGEAVVLDLPGGTLIALLRKEEVGVAYPHNIVTRHLARQPQANIPQKGDWRATRQAISNVKPAFELYPDEYPLLVRFRDINNPATVERVDPTDLAAAFGPGVRLRRITVAVTDDEVEAEKMRGRLPWLSSDSNSDKRMKANFAPNDWSFAATVRHGDFARGS